MPQHEVAEAERLHDVAEHKDGNFVGQDGVHAESGKAATGTVIVEPV